MRVLLLCFALTGCINCPERLDADLQKYGQEIALIKYQECTEAKARSAQAFQQGMAGVSNSFHQKSLIYSNQLPVNINYSGYTYQ